MRELTSLELQAVSGGRLAPVPVPRRILTLGAIFAGIVRLAFGRRVTLPPTDRT